MNQYEHQIRLAVIVAAFVACLGAAVYLTAEGKDSGTLFGAVMGWLALLVPALLDSIHVAKQLQRRNRRRDDIPTDPQLRRSVQ